MPRGPGGTCTIPITFVADTDALASEVNTDFADVISMLTDSLSRSGLGGMQANLEMGGFKLVNLGAPTVGSDAVTKTYGDATYATSVTLASYVKKDGTTVMTGNLPVSNGAPAVQLIETDAANKNWYMGANGGIWRITEDTQADANTRLQIAPGGVVTISGSLVLGTALAVAQGGTGATTAAAARTNLGLGTMATQNANAVAITAGTITGLTSFSVSGTVTSSQNFQSSTGSVVLGTTGAGTVFLRPNGVGSTTGQMTIDSAGNLVAAGTVTADNLTAAGDPQGSTWSPWGSSSAFIAINARIETRANAYATNAQNNAIANIMPTIAAQGATAVGTYVFAYSNNGGNITIGQFTAGTSLTPSNGGGSLAGAAIGGGTWQCMGHMNTANNSTRSTLWMRAS